MKSLHTGLLVQLETCFKTLVYIFNAYHDHGECQKIVPKRIFWFQLFIQIHFFLLAVNILFLLFLVCKCERRKEGEEVEVAVGSCNILWFGITVHELNDHVSDIW